MATNEYSMLWATGATGDGASAYDSDKTRLLWNSMFSNGVFKGYLNDLAVSGTATPISVATGAAIVQGYPYFSDGDAVTKAIATPIVGTTGFRVVLRCDWGGNVASEVTPPLYAATDAATIRVLVISNADGTAAIPDATTTDGDVYDLTLATGTITTAGVIALTDARTYAMSRLNPRTRSFMVTADNFSIYSAGSSTTEKQIWGLPMSNTATTLTHCMFQVPQDYSASLTVSPILLNKETGAGDVGNIRYSMSVDYGAVGEDIETHTADVAEATLAVANTELLIVAGTATLSSAAAGDVVVATWTRDGADALDTYAGDGLYFIGFRVSYTALL